MSWLNWHFLLPFFHWCDSTALRDALRRSESDLASLTSKAVGVPSFGLWLMVGAGGRAIGFV
jgi:hypothetical protein